ncbi:MAG: hypothetical protein AAF443_04540 [Chlamydiota bacterium]
MNLCLHQSRLERRGGFFKNVLWWIFPKNIRSEERALANPIYRAINNLPQGDAFSFCLAYPLASAATICAFDRFHPYFHPKSPSLKSVLSGFAFGLIQGGINWGIKRVFLNQPHNHQTTVGKTALFVAKSFFASLACNFLALILFKRVAFLFKFYILKQDLFRGGSLLSLPTVLFIGSFLSCTTVLAELIVFGGVWIVRKFNSR